MSAFKERRLKVYINLLFLNKKNNIPIGYKYAKYPNLLEINCSGSSHIKKQTD